MSSDVIRQPLLSIEEAAAYLNVPTGWVTEAVRERKIRCTRIGKHVRFRPEHLEEIIEAGEQPVTASTQQLASVPKIRTRGVRSRL